MVRVVGSHRMGLGFDSLIVALLQNCDTAGYSVGVASTNKASELLQCSLTELNYPHWHN